MAYWWNGFPRRVYERASMQNLAINLSLLVGNTDRYYFFIVEYIEKQLKWRSDVLHNNSLKCRSLGKPVMSGLRWGQGVKHFDTKRPPLISCTNCLEVSSLRETYCINNCLKDIMSSTVLWYSSLLLYVRWLHTLLGIRLRAVPQDGHASEEIERRERKQKTWSRGEAGEEASLQFPSRPFRSLQSCRDSTDLRGTARSLSWYIP